jgi:hypothetical protein
MKIHWFHKADPAAITKYPACRRTLPLGVPEQQADRTGHGP